MHSRFLSAVILVMALGWASISDGLMVRVSENGADDISCRESNATFPCRSLGFALEALKDSSNRNETIFTFLVDAGSVYSLNESVKINQTSTSVIVYLKSSSNLTGGRSIIRCADAKAGIEIGSNTSKTRNINFVDLEFQNCSSRSVAAVVLIWNSRDINFTNCVFRNNTKAGINAFDSSVAIERCHFLNNTSNGYNSGEPYIEGVTSAGGGVGFLYQKAWNLSLIVKDSIFEFNSAVTNDTTEFVAPTYLVSQNIILGGGGFLVVFRKNAQFCRAWIENTRFANNSATIGGGLYVEQSELAMGNHFIMVSSNLSGNTAGQAAGGLSLSQWNNASSFTTVFKNCIVSENEAQRGAGMNVFFMNSDATYNDSVLRFEAVKFSNNHARASSAIRFTTAQPYGSNVDLSAEFINCSFNYHKMSIFARTSPFTSQRINLMFKGNNIFQQNSGGGAAAFQDCVVHVDGKLTFANNTGSNGGALLIMSSQIKLYPYSELTFIGNHATGLGGAVYVQEHMMDEFIHENNPDCFLAYINPFFPPSKWKTNVSFIENCSNVKGAAIYISSLRRCVWSETTPHHSPKKALRWDKFLYKNNSLVWNDGTKVLSGDLYDIATDTKEYKTNKKSLKVSPGEIVPLSLKAVDELGGDVITSVFAFEIDRLNSAQKLLLDDSLFVVFPHESVPFSFRLTEGVYNKRRKKNRTIMFTDVYSTLKNSLSVELELRDCHPGFIFSDDSKKCLCNTKLEGVQRCENGNKVFLKNGYWGNSTSSGEFVTYFCPFNYCNCSNMPGLPGCLFSADNSDGQCADNREGWMCGKCKAKTSVGLRRTECTECSKSGWVLALVIPIVIILCVVIIWLNPGISSELRGPLFFYQVLPFIFDPIGKNTYIFLATDIFNFGGPFNYFLNTCLVRGINNLYAITFGYAVPLLVLTVFFLAYLFSHRLTFSRPQRSMLRSFWFLLLFVYNYLVETSFRILFCPNVAGNHVFFYDGSIQCFHGSHLPTGIVAIIVLVVLVIPPPIAVFLLTNGYWRVKPQWSDTLTNSLRPKRCWWWSVDLCRRLLLVAIYAFVANWKTKKILMTVACMVILAVHSNCQPYMRPRANYAESVYLLVLSILAMMQTVEDQETAFYVCLVLLITAAIHTLVVFFLKAGLFCRRRFKCCTGEETPDDQRHRYQELENTENEESRDTEIERRRSILETILSKPTGVSNCASDANSSARPEIIDRSDSTSPGVPTCY